MRCFRTVRKWCRDPLFYAWWGVTIVDLNLITICSIAFGAVFVLLTFLAVVMQLITVVFPATRVIVDQTVVAVVSTAVASMYPGARVTKIEEES